MSDQAPADGGQGGTSTAAALSARAAAPAAPTSTQVAQPPAAPAATGVEWLTGADETAVGYVQNKGWKTPNDMLSSYQNLEKLMGADRAGRTLVMPGENADPKDVAAFYEKLGRPSDAKGYSVKPMEGQDPKTLEPFLSKFHELGMTDKQAAGITEFIREAAGKQTAEAEASKQMSFQADNAALKTEWGAAYTERLAAASAAARGLELDAQTIDKISDAIGHKATMNLLAKIGGKTGEDKFVSGNGPTGSAMTPGQAKAAIQAKMNDREFAKRYTGGDADARAEMARLHEFAYGQGS